MLLTNLLSAVSTESYIDHVSPQNIGANEGRLILWCENKTCEKRTLSAGLTLSVITIIYRDHTWILTSLFLYFYAQLLLKKNPFMGRVAA